MFFDVIQKFLYRFSRQFLFTKSLFLARVLPIKIIQIDYKNWEWKWSVIQSGSFNFDLFVTCRSLCMILRAEDCLQGFAGLGMNLGARAARTVSLSGTPGTWLSRFLCNIMGTQISPWWRQYFGHCNPSCPIRFRLSQSEKDHSVASEEIWVATNSGIQNIEC